MYAKAGLVAYDGRSDKLMRGAGEQDTAEAENCAKSLATQTTYLDSTTAFRKYTGVVSFLGSVSSRAGELSRKAEGLLRF